MSAASASSFRLCAAAASASPVAFLCRLLRDSLADPARPGPRHTLLAVCPNSEAVARAALQAAQEARAPLLFAATLNQVDRDGGYTGWTPAAFAQFVDAESTRLGLDVPVFLGLDHGGPWKKDAHVRDDLDYDAALTETKHSITACIEAGYDLLHLDPTTDRGSSTVHVPIDRLVERTIGLMRHAEETRRSVDRGPVAFEVGVEETDGLNSEARFRSFCKHLAGALSDTALPRPSFVVGDVGTALASPAFDADRARRLATTAEEHLGALLKGHYTDDVTAPERYPINGVGGANVGPGLSAVEAEAVRDLAALEARLGASSDMLTALQTAVVESNRWRKWLRPDEQGHAFEALPDERQRWLINTGSRYVWTVPAVKRARASLYENVAAYRDAEAYVQWKLKTAVMRYLHAFNLVGLADQLKETRSDDGL
ncbi:MAG: class II D-tagatose-bisphosphate aldolase non-catalytic subunit [Salinivenus sp.]